MCTYLLFCPKFEGENLFEKFSAEMEFCKIGPLSKVYSAAAILRAKTTKIVLFSSMPILQVQYRPKDSKPEFYVLKNMSKNREFSG
jgi:hypothetical protein